MNRERLLEIHRRRNEEARLRPGDNAEEHRRRISALLEKIPPQRRDSIAFLGAGNCEELNLPELATMFDRIDLYDLDRQALESGLRAQFPLGAPGHIATIEFEATGLPPLFNESMTVEAEAIARTLAQPLDLPDRPAQGYSAIVSLCLLSQLVEILAETLHPLPDEMAAWATLVRKQHCEMAWKNLSSEGVLLLVTDFVSERTLPAIEKTPVEQIPQLARQALESGNVFAGLHPGVIFEDLRRHNLSGGCSGPDVWVWSYGPRHFLVAGFSAKKK